MTSRKRRDRDGNDGSQDSLEQQATNLKCRWMEPLAAMPASDASCTLQTKQFVAFEERLVSLVLQNLEDTRALQREVVSLAEQNHHVLSL